MPSFSFKRRKSKGSSSKRRVSETPTSTKSAPGQYDDSGSLNSHLNKKAKGSRESRDVGNHTAPIPGSGPYMNGNYVPNGEIDRARARSPIYPEITSIKSQRNSTDRSLLRIRSKRDRISDTNDSDGQQSFAESNQGPSKYNSTEPALLSLPIQKSDTLPPDRQYSSSARSNLLRSSRSNLSLNQRPIASSSPNHKESGSSGRKSTEIETPTDVEAHMAKTDSTLKKPLNNSESNNSGILSSLVSAAHNAASHIGTITSSRPPDEFKSHPPEVPHENTEGTSFLQHLDSLLFSQNKKSSREASAELAADNDDDDDRASQITGKSLAHDVVFQPVRKTVLSTMGKGELTLEALGFTDAGKLSERNSMGQVPLISVEGAPDTRIAPQRSRSRDLIANGGDGNGISKVMSGPGKLSSAIDVSKSHDDGFDSKTSASPAPAFRRSLSPNLAKLPKSTTAVPTQDSLVSTAKKLTHRRSVSSGTENANGVNHTTSILSDETSSTGPHGSQVTPTVSAIELKDVTYASSKRNADFHSMFKKLPSSERLLEDYSCALQKDILVQGRMYISERYICFNANILGWTTNVVIPLQEIVQLEKKSIVGLIPNSIVIQTLHQKYIFASFLSRDATFDLITNIWNKLVRGPGNIDMQVDLNDDFSQNDMDSVIDSEEDYDDDEDDEDDDDDDEDLDGDSTSDARNIGPMKHAETEPDHKEVNGETKIKQDTVDAPLGKVFQALFGDDTSTMKRILEAQKNKDISAIPKFSKDGDVPKREYKYIKPLSGAVGPKETSCQVVETIDHQDFKSYVLVTQATKTPDVPSGNSFSVQTQVYLSWGPNNSTTITVYTSVQWTAKSWIKGAVERGSIDGQKESIAILIDELKKIFSESDVSETSEGEGASSLPTMGPATHEPTENGYTKASGDTQISEDTFNAPLGTIYSILFGDDPTYFKSILEAQKNFDITPIPNFQKEGDLKKRQYSYTKPLNGPIGPKQTRCNITETIEHFDVNKYILVKQVTASPDVPSGNAFTVVTDFYFSWGSNNSTKLLVITSINWTGKSWIKGPIEKGTIDGQNESIGILVSELKSILSKGSSGKKGKKKSKTKSRANSTKDNIKTPTEEMQANNPLGFIGQFHSQYSFGIFIILVVVLWVAVRWFVTPKAPILSIDHVQKVIIEGREYMIMPSIDDSVKREKLREDSEYEIWKWINERKNADRVAAAEKDHKNQDLNEMVRLAEQHLQVLKNQIARDENSSSDLI